MFCCESFLFSSDETDLVVRGTCVSYLTQTSKKKRTVERFSIFVALKTKEGGHGSKTKYCQAQC